MFFRRPFKRRLLDRDTGHLFTKLVVSDDRVVKDLLCLRRAVWHGDFYLGHLVAFLYFSASGLVIIGSIIRLYGNHREHEVKLDRMEGTASRVGNHHTAIEVLGTKVTVLDQKVDEVKVEVSKVSDTQNVILEEIRRGRD